MSEEEAAKIAEDHGARIRISPPAKPEVFIQTPEHEPVRVESLVIQADGSCDVVVREGVSDEDAQRVSRIIAEAHVGIADGEVRIRRIPAE